MKLGLALFLLALPLVAQRATAVFIYVTNARPIAGSSLPVQVMAIDASSTLLGSTNAIWTSNNPNVAEYRDGQIVTKAPGLADITATVFGARGLLRLQVLPARIEVTPVNAKAEVGQQIDYKATVYSASGAVIPDLAIRWEVLSLDGGINNGISISRTGGSLTAFAVGQYTVRAHFDYTGIGAGQFQPAYSSSTRLTVDPKRYYKTKLMLPTQTSVSGFGLTPRSSRLSMNESGDLAFLASADGLGTAVVRAKGKTLELAALTGVTIGRPGTVVGDFDDVAIGNNGEVLTVGQHYGIEQFGSARSVFLVTRPGVARAGTLAGLIAGGADAINNFRFGRRTYNNPGRYAYLADYSLPGTRTNRTGLFVGDGNFDELIFGSGDTLPGMLAPFTFPNEFSIDDQDNVWFVVVDAENRRALCYRSATEFSVKVIVNPADGVGGYKPASMDNVVCAPSGTVAFRVRDNALGWVMVVLAKPVLAGAKLVTLPSDHRAIYSVNAKGDALFFGNFGSGAGIYLVPASGPTRAIALLNRAAPNGEVYMDFRGGAMNARGEIAFASRTSVSPFVVVRDGGLKDEVVFPQPGLQFPDTMRLTFTNLLPNIRNGAPKFISGSSQVGVVEVTSRGPRVLMTPDLTLPSGQFFGDYNVWSGQPDGSVLASSDTASYRYNDAGAEMIVQGRTNLAGGTQNGAYRLSANSSGALLSAHNTSFGVARLNLTVSGQTRLIGFFGNTNDAALRTPAPGGGYFTSIGQIEIDDAGTPYAFANTSTGRSGVFQFINAAWVEMVVINQTVVDGNTVRSIGGWDVGRDRLYANVGYGAGRSAILDCPGACSVRFDYRTEMPNGNLPNGFGQISANRKNDVAFTYFVGNVEDAAVAPFGEGARLVTGRNQPLPGGEWIQTFRNLQLRDDGRLLMLAMTTNDNIGILEAEPLN